MATAMIYPESDNKGGRGKKNLFLKNDFDDSQYRKARIVLAVMPELAKQVN